MVELTLKWEKFGLCQDLHDMMKRQELVDVTVMCEGQFLQAHKNVLSACSSQFRQIFKAAPDKSPIVVLRGVSVEHFKSLLEFMYTGQATVFQDSLAEFIAVADDLGVSALGKNTKESETPQRLPPERYDEDDIQAAPASAQTRLVTEHSTPVVPSLPSPDNERIETAFDMDCQAAESPDIKEEEIEVHDIKDDDDDSWNAVSMGDADHAANVPNTPVIQSVQGSYVDPQNGVQDDPGPSTSQGSYDYAQDGIQDDPGPSTSQDGEPRPEEPTPTLRRSIRPIKRKTPSSPTPSTDDSDNDEEPPQSDSPASQGSASYQGKTKIPYFATETPPKNQEAATPGNKPHKCCFCPLTFDYELYKREHVKEVHSGGPVTCVVCQKVFSKLRTGQTHYADYHSGQIHVCHICNLKYSTKGSLKEHYRNYHGDLAVPHECKICHKICKNKKNLLNHSRSMHKNLI